MKIFTSKLGLKFSISAVPRPGEGDVVFFTEEEWIWIKSKGLSPEEFKCLWYLKKEDFRYNPIPEREDKRAEDLAKKYASEIIGKLKGSIGRIEE